MNSMMMIYKEVRTEDEEFDLRYIIVKGNLKGTSIGEELDEIGVGLLYDSKFDLTYLSRFNYSGNDSGELDSLFSKSMDLLKDNGYKVDSSLNENLKDVEFSVEGEVEFDGEDYYGQIYINMDWIDDLSEEDETLSAIPYDDIIYLMENMYLTDEGFLLETEESSKAYKELINKSHIINNVEEME